MSGLLGGIFADVVFFPQWVGTAAIVLIAALALLAVGLLVKYIGKAKRNKKNREEKK